ncbi:MAG: hypothetical protein U5K55_02400 [Aliarcobacter sp.]|nr:hypothetical protein [Aliarcobacter sp.]
MFNKKIIVIFSFVAVLSTSLFARQQDPDMISYKDYVEKKDRHPSKSNTKAKTEKKVEKKEKVIGKLKGQIAELDFLNSGSMINTNKYENIKNTDLYRIQEKVYRISSKTREILDILN